ncbi:hypothetical protein [Clostridium sp.]|uniref:hypothetical protein n=1 Tax=Clostridium sp. TaxID=1506 RepID=UPI002629AC9E
MKTSTINFFNFVLFISFLCIFIKSCFIYKRLFSKTDSYYLVPITKKDIQKLTSFKFLSAIIQLTVVAALQLIVFLYTNKINFLNISSLYFLIGVFNLSISINKDYIYRNFKLIKKSNIDYFNLDYKEHIVKIYLKDKKKPIVIAFKNDLSNFAKLLNELGYGELLTRKNF